MDHMMRRIMVLLERAWMEAEVHLDPNKTTSAEAAEWLVGTQTVEFVTDLPGGDRDALREFRGLASDIQLGLGLIVVRDHGIQPGRVIDVHRTDKTSH